VNKFGLMMSNLSFGHSSNGTGRTRAHFIQSSQSGTEEHSSHTTLLPGFP